MMRVLPVSRKPISLILFSLLILTACQKVNIQYGQQYIDNGLTNIILVDSISPSVSTIFKDSVITSQSGTAMLGVYTDPFFGKINSSSFIPLVPSTNTIPDLLGNAQYDSVVVLMKSDGSYYGDTTLPATYSVNQLTSEINLQDQSFFFNTTSFPVNATPLGSAIVNIRPGFKDTARIHLNDGLGSFLFGLVKRKSDTLKTSSIFANYFKGLQVSAQGGNAVYGFKDSVVMRVYYHETDLYRQFKYFDFTLSSKSLQFNHISYDRSGTPLAVLNNSNRELPSSQANNAGFSQSSTGIYLKIAFPTIQQLLQRPDFVQLIKAELIIKPINGSYNGNFLLPPQLVAAVTDALNEPGFALSTGGSAATIETGNLFRDPLVSGNTNYSYDITSFLAQQLTVTGINQNGLLLVPPAGSRNTTMNRLIIGDIKNAITENRIQLKVYYVSVNH